MPVTDLSHGQLWWADLTDEKIRPVLVLTRGWVAPKLNRVLVAPITSTIREIPSEVPLGGDEGLDRQCVVNLDNAQLVETSRLLAAIGVMPPQRWAEVCRAMSHVIGC